MTRPKYVIILEDLGEKGACKIVELDRHMAPVSKGGPCLKMGALHSGHRIFVCEKRPMIWKILNPIGYNWVSFHQIVI
jgi:hypothetical protein